MKFSILPIFSKFLYINSLESLKLFLLVKQKRLYSKNGPK